MSLVFQTLGLADIDEVYAYAKRRLALDIPDEVERRFRSWEVAWRREALEHYLKLGWSFIVRRDVGNGLQTVGFFLAQPFLFFRGQTQTVWVEHVEADDAETTAALIEVAIKVAREKNFQRALFATSGTSGEKLAHELQKWAPTLLPDRIVEVRTSKG